MTRVGFGLIGLGRISGAHLKGLRAAGAYARLVAVCDSDGDRARSVAAEHGARAYTDYRDLVADGAVEAVDIPLPHSLHYDVALQALEAGKHVLVEKPMAPTESQCEQLIEAARSRGLLLSVAENTRFVEAYIEAARLIEKGALGTLRLIRTLISGSSIARLTNRSDWKRSAAGAIGGTIFDAAPHSVYLLRWLSGDIESLRAIRNKIVDASEVEDHAIVAGRMKSGATFTTEYTFTAEVPWNERVEIYGSKGSLIIDQLRQPPAVFFRHREDFLGTPLGVIRHDPEHWKAESIAAGVAAFARAVHLREAAPVDPRDGQYAMRAVERAYASIARDSALVAM